MIQGKDKAFATSPGVGMPECVCSRCGSRIKKGEAPLRILSERIPPDMPFNLKGVEYRYCEQCYLGIKYFLCYLRDFGVCDEQCAVCKDQENHI